MRERRGPCKIFRRLERHCPVSMIKLRKHLAIEFLLALLLHGLVMVLVYVLIGLSQKEPPADSKVGLKALEILPMASSDSASPSASVASVVPMEAREVPISEALPELPSIPAVEPQGIPVYSEVQSTALVSAGWVDLISESKPSGTAGGASRMGSGSGGYALPELNGFSRPKYPFAARQRGEEGRVKLRVLVNAEGKAQETRVAQSSGYGDLDRTAVEAVSKATFRPAQRGGKPVEAECELVFEFRLED